MFKSISVLLLVCLAFISISGQKLTVLDTESGLPLEYVAIMSVEKNIIIYTDKYGQAEVSNFKNQTNISISMIGYVSELITWQELVSRRFTIALKTSMNHLDQVIVSATRWSQSMKNIPYRISTLGAKQISFQNPQTSADLLGISGRVFIQKSQQGGGSPMIRGFASNRLLYSLDGVRMNTAIFRAGNIQNVISFDPFANESVEILFGPGSVMYGSDAIGGVMSFQTLSHIYSKGENLTTLGSATTRYSTANREKTGHLHFKIGSDKLASVTSLTYHDFGDLRMGSHGPDIYLKKWNVVRVGDKDVIVANIDSLIQSPSGYTQLNLMQKLAYRINSKTEIQYAFHYSGTSEFDRYDRHIRYKNGLPRYGEWKYGPQKWMMHYLNLTLGANTKLYDQMTVRLAYQKFDESRIDRDIYKPTRHIRTERVDAYSANIDFVKKISNQHQLNYGIELVYNDIKSEGKDINVLTNISQSGPSRYPQADWISGAFFAGYDHTLSPKTNLMMGMRYSFFDIKAKYDNNFYPFPFASSHNTFGALTGSLGIINRPSDAITLMANISSGFRAPNVDDIGKVFDAAVGFVTVPNPDLQPEYAYNAEIGAAYTLGERLRLDASLYYTLLKNALVKRAFTLNGQDSIMYDGVLSQVEAIQNGAYATVKGLQIGLECKFGYGIWFRSVYNIQKGVEELDNDNLSPSRHAAPNFGLTSLTWQKQKWTLSVISQYSAGKRYEQLAPEEQNKPELYAVDGDGKPYSPSWLIFSLKGLYGINKNFDMQASVENITNLRYKTYSSGIAAAGRNFVISATYKF